MPGSSSVMHRSGPLGQFGGSESLAKATQEASNRAQHKRPLGVEPGKKEPPQPLRVCTKRQPEHQRSPKGHLFSEGPSSIWWLRACAMQFAEKSCGPLPGFSCSSREGAARASSGGECKGEELSSPEDSVPGSVLGGTLWGESGSWGGRRGHGAVAGEGYWPAPPLPHPVVLLFQGLHGF